MSTLTITKQSGNFFSLQLNSEDAIISEQNRLTTVGNICHFKTVSGANIIKSQNIAYSDITLVASGSFTFASINALWLKLIEVGFFDGLATGGGGGGGVDNFTELLDTFNSYIGRDGQALVVNESELKIETVPFANVSAFTDLSDVPSPLLPNKMIVTNALGTALIMTDLPITPETYLNAVGSFHYSDLATTGTPLTIVATVPKKLTNDTLGDYTVTSNAPYGVSSVWNSIDNQLDFSQMTIGDLLTLRVDANITTSSANQTLKCYMKMGVGSASEFDLILTQGLIKSAGTYPFVAEVSFDLAYQDIVDNPAEIYVLSDGNGSIVINGWYIDILRKNINIVEIEAASDPLKEDVANKVSAISGSSEIEYPNEKAVVDYVDSKLPTEYTTIVYIDTTDPSDATIFDIENPPVTNDDDLKEDTANLYIGTDSSTWVWNGSIYTTKVIPESSNFYVNGTTVDAGNNKTSPINREGPISVMEFGNKGISIWKHTLSFWKHISGVGKYVNVFIDNITNTYDVQFPNKSGAITETLAMMSDVDEKLDKGAYAGTDAQSLKDEIDTKLDASAYNQHFKGVYVTLSALNAALPIASVGDYAQVNEVGGTDVVNYNWDAEESIWVAGGGAGGAATTDALPEGSTNLYFTSARVLATVLSGLSLATGGTIVSTDSVLVAFGKLQKQINDALTAIGLKADIASPTFTGTVTTPAIVVSSETASTIASFDASKNVKSLSTSTYPSLTELAYVKGLTSALQSQLDAKQPKGVRITNATTTGSYAIDWNAADVWQLTLTGATTITDSNLPTGTATKVIELMVKGAFSITLPAYWEATPSSGAYTGVKWNHFVISCIVGTASSEKVIYSNEVLAT